MSELVDATDRAWQVIEIPRSGTMIESAKLRPLKSLAEALWRPSPDAQPYLPMDLLVMFAARRTDFVTTEWPPSPGRSRSCPSNAKERRMGLLVATSISA